MLLDSLLLHLKMRYSYVLHVPPNHPSLSDATHRWQTFLGEFVKPIADKYPDLLFWCSDYGLVFRFRIHSNSHEIHNFVVRQIQGVGLVFNQDEEKDNTLSGDLGASRFIEQSLGVDAINRRANCVLIFLCSTVRLYLDGLFKIDDLHWQYRATPDHENPLGNNFESLAHLMANISQFEFDVRLSVYTAQTAWQQPRSDAIFRCRLW